MNKLTFKGSWNEVSGKLKKKYANLTDNDLMYKDGRDQELLGRLERRLGQTEDEVRKLIASV